jgi:hypothetical protein
MDTVGFSNSNYFHWQLNCFVDEPLLFFLLLSFNDAIDFQAFEWQNVRKFAMI